VGTSASKICPVTIHGAYALKNIQIVPSARENSNLTKDGACWPCCNGQQSLSNAEKVGPTSVVPPLHEVA
jgi:hypothetical protein